MGHLNSKQVWWWARLRATRRLLSVVRRSCTSSVCLLLIDTQTLTTGTLPVHATNGKLSAVCASWALEGLWGLAAPPRS